jgi:hypothetical protein
MFYQITKCIFLFHLFPIDTHMLHEMLQNRLVLKSLAYMIVDLVLVELFPELNDFVTGAECLEKDA